MSREPRRWIARCAVGVLFYPLYACDYDWSFSNPPHDAGHPFDAPDAPAMSDGPGETMDGDIRDGGSDAASGARSCDSPDGGPGLNDCPNATTGSSSCCASLEVEGGTFLRSYDTKTFDDDSYPATVSSLRLDRYEVTVGRFRRFVEAVVTGKWRPSPGSGKHLHLNGGKGLRSATSPGFETGWDASWPLPSTTAAWSADLACGEAGYDTWTNAPGPYESHPINCVDWYQAYAFCIFDGGFLPSETEWNYAAAGGGNQRVYPWSDPFSSSSVTCMQAIYDGTACGNGTSTVGSTSPQGDGRWLQADLAGNVRELVLDTYAPYVNPCVDCANVSQPADSTNRGGSYTSTPMYLFASFRGKNAETNPNLGVRCARAP
jgi:sulfatase modifying factor 1